MCRSSPFCSLAVSMPSLIEMKRTPDAKWSARAVIRILQEETYTGVLLQGRQQCAGYEPGG